MLLVKEAQMETLGNRLRTARNRRLMTQRELAEATGVMEATISRIENDRFTRRPLRSTLEALASALAVSVSWLVFGEDEGNAAA
jgi:transcriptional regulator with XRE-family HTH domain